MSKEDLKYFLIEFIEASDRLNQCMTVIGKDKLKIYSEELKQDPRILEALKKLSSIEDSMLDGFE